MSSEKSHSSCLPAIRYWRGLLTQRSGELDLLVWLFLPENPKPRGASAFSTDSGKREGTATRQQSCQRAEGAGDLSAASGLPIPGLEGFQQMHWKGSWPGGAQGRQTRGGARQAERTGSRRGAEGELGNPRSPSGPASRSRGIS